MKIVLILLIFVFVKRMYAGDSVVEMETDICKALTNNTYLLSSTFTNQLSAALNSSSVEMRSEAYMLLSINAYQNFLRTADDSWLQIEMSNASNAVVAIGIHSNKWQYWTSRFLYASAYCSVPNYERSFAVATNSLHELSCSAYNTNDVNAVERAILDKSELLNVGITDAMRIFAGMSAAELGMGGVATNYANQVPAPYRNVMLQFVK